VILTRGHLRPATGPGWCWTSCAVWGMPRHIWRS